MHFDGDDTPDGIVGKEPLEHIFLSASVRRECVPGRERVHVVSPVHDFPVLNLDDRAKPIVVLHARL